MESIMLCTLGLFFLACSFRIEGAKRLIGQELLSQCLS